MRTYLFVYGLLRKGINHDMSLFLAGKGQYLGKGYINAKLFDLGFYPAIEPSDGHRVVGDVYDISECREEVLAATDEFEEVGPDFQMPNEYRREQREVCLADDNKLVMAYAYIYNKGEIDGVFIESGDYLTYLRSHSNS